jgi:hypothetical protein
MLYYGSMRLKIGFQEKPFSQNRHTEFYDKRSNGLGPDNRSQMNRHDRHKKRPFFYFVKEAYEVRR